MIFATNQEALDKYSENTNKAEIYKADADAGWRKNIQSNRIDVNIGTFKPGTSNPFKMRFEGQILNIKAVHATCPCTSKLKVKKDDHPDFGKYHVISGELGVLDLESLQNTDQNVRNGAKVVSRTVAVDVLYEESERDAFIESEEGEWFSNPLALWTRVNVTYNIALD